MKFNKTVVRLLDISLLTASSALRVLLAVYHLATPTRAHGMIVVHKQDKKIVGNLVKIIETFIQIFSHF